MSISCGFIILKAHYRVGMLIKNMIGEDITYKSYSLCSLLIIIYKINILFLMYNV